MDSITLEGVVAHGRPEGVDQRGLVGQGLAAVRLDFAGWISIVAAATSVPRLIVEITLSTLGGEAPIVHAGMKVLDGVLGVYLFALLRRLLNGRFSFHPTDSVIAWWTGFGAFFCAVNVFLPRWNGKPIALAALVAGITAGIVLDIVLGVILFRLKDDPYGCLKAYAFSHIASGVCIIASTML